MLADNGKIDLETRTALLGDSREQDFRALLRALRERVVDATGLLEDGSALGVQGEVQGRRARQRRVPAAGPPLRTDSRRTDVASADAAGAAARRRQAGRCRRPRRRRRSRRRRI